MRTFEDKRSEKEGDGDPKAILGSDILKKKAVSDPHVQKRANLREIRQVDKRSRSKHKVSQMDSVIRSYQCISKH